MVTFHAKELQCTLLNHSLHNFQRYTAVWGEIAAVKRSTENTASVFFITFEIYYLLSESSHQGQAVAGSWGIAGQGCTSFLVMRQRLKQTQTGTQWEVFTVQSPD